MSDTVTARVLQNTLEQTALLAAAVGGLVAWGACGAAAALVPWFVVARLVFAAGYCIHPLYRGVGMAMTHLPIAASLGWCAAQLLARGVGAGLA